MWLSPRLLGADESSSFPVAASLQRRRGNRPRSSSPCLRGSDQGPHPHLPSEHSGKRLRKRGQFELFVPTSSRSETPLELQAMADRCGGPGGAGTDGHRLGSHGHADASPRRSQVGGLAGLTGLHSRCGQGCVPARGHPLPPLTVPPCVFKASVTAPASLASAASSSCTGHLWLRLGPADLTPLQVVPHSRSLTCPHLQRPFDHGR